jgi:hypothetical protein
VIWDIWSCVLYRTAFAAVHHTWLAPTCELSTMSSAPLPALNCAWSIRLGSTGLLLRSTYLMDAR